MLESVTEIRLPPVTAVSSGKFDIRAFEGKNTNAPGAASVAHITPADKASQAAAITLVIEYMFQRCICSFQCADDGVQICQLHVHQPTQIIIALAL